MNIGKKYTVTADELNMTLSERFMSQPRDGTAKIGKLKVIGFYSSIPNALKALVNLKVNETKLTDLKTVMAKLDEIYELIDKAIGGNQ